MNADPVNEDFPIKEFPHKRVFVAEFVCGGGMCGTPIDQIPSSLLWEGELMWRALVEDISQWAEVTSPIDARLSLHRANVSSHCVVMNPQKRLWSQWIAAAQGCEQVVIVAPETDCLLTQGISAFRAAGFQVLAVSNAALCLTSDKWQTAKWLHREGIPHPETWAWNASGSDLVHSAPIARVGDTGTTSDRKVDRYWVKPRDGCGAMGIRCFDQFDDAIDSMSPHEITQRHAEGQSGSIMAVGNGVDHSYALMSAVWQSFSHSDAHVLSDDRSALVNTTEPLSDWTYQGGFGPVASDIQRRAESLAERVFEALPGKLGGFIGVDWIAADDPSLDCVIEVNPRLTTSYIGLRQIVDENLTRRLLPNPVAQPIPAGKTIPIGKPIMVRRPKLLASTESVDWSISRPFQSPQSHPNRRPPH